MAKLIPMHEAAQMLGLTFEELNDLRSRNEIFGYRDGSSWKFKEEEIQRVAALRAADMRAGPGDAKEEDEGSSGITVAARKYELVAGKEIGQGVRVRVLDKHASEVHLYVGQDRGTDGGIECGYLFVNPLVGTYVCRFPPVLVGEHV